MSDRQEIVELYGIYVQTITANEQRRQALAAFYLSLVAAGIAMLALDKDIQYLTVAIPISIISLVWFATIRYFRNLAQAKFKVIGDLEAKFEIKPFTDEWRYYKDARGKWRIGLTHLELIVPATLFITSISYIGYTIIAQVISKFAC